MQQDNSELHRALMDLVDLINRPRRDEVLLRKAGVSLERALFPLLARIGVHGPLGVVELAERAGRDHSTVSRQVAKLERLGLVRRQPDRADRRVRVAATTAAGRRMIESIGSARQQLFDELLASWSTQERKELTRLVRKVVDSAGADAADD